MFAGRALNTVKYFNLSVRKQTHQPRWTSRRASLDDFPVGVSLANDYLLLNYAHCNSVKLGLFTLEEKL